MHLEENDSQSLDIKIKENSLENDSNFNEFSRNSEIDSNDDLDMGMDESNFELDSSSISDDSDEQDISDIGIEENKEKNGANKRKFLFLLLFLLLGTIALIVIPRLSPNSVGDDDVNNIGGIINGLPDGMDEEELLEQLQKKVDDSEFTISVNTRPTFANGSARAKIDIVNSPGNNYPCKVEIILDDTSQIIYQNNDLIYPDQHIPYIRLNKNLSKGVYDATITYYVYDAEGKTQTGVMSAALEIIIQN